MYIVDLYYNNSISLVLMDTLGSMEVCCECNQERSLIEYVCTCPYLRGSTENDLFIATEQCPF